MRVLLKLSFIVLIISCFVSCDFSLNPNGPPDETPYFIINNSITIKGITIPTGTRLEYEKSFFRKKEQSSLQNEKYLTGIELPEGETISWGGVPVNRIYKFFNTEMSGYTVFPDFETKPYKETAFYAKWKEEGCRLGITVKNRDDWSFNKANITDVESCSVNYQRYFKDDKKQQDFLDKMHSSLLEVH